MSFGNCVKLLLVCVAVPNNSVARFRCNSWACCHSYTRVRQRQYVKALVKLLITLYCSIILPPDAMHSADYAVARCPSVCSSVCHTPVFCGSGYTYPPTYFTVVSGSHTILGFTHQTGWQYFNGDPLTEVQNARGMKNSRFSTNVSLYLWKNTR